MDDDVFTAYLVCTPDPKDYKNISGPEETPIWIKFGDTKDTKNTRVSGYNTCNPSFYALTIHAAVEDLKPDLGKYLEKWCLEDKKDAYQQVKIENREKKDGETEWYKVVSWTTYKNVLDLFRAIDAETYPGVSTKSLGVRNNKNEGVWGKVLSYEGTTREELAEAFNSWLNA